MLNVVYERCQKTARINPAGTYHASCVASYKLVFVGVKGQPQDISSEAASGDNSLVTDHMVGTAVPNGKRLLSAGTSY